MSGMVPVLVCLTQLRASQSSLPVAPDDDDMLQGKKEKKKREKKKEKEVIQIPGPDQDSRQPSVFQELQREVRIPEPVDSAILLFSGSLG